MVLNMYHDLNIKDEIIYFALESQYLDLLACVSLRQFF